MDLSIAPADFDSPELETFVAAHLADLAPTAPAESQHAKALAALAQVAARMWVATLDGRIVGTAALAPVEPLHEEVKSMRTDPTCRGLGIGRGLLEHLLQDAHTRGIQRVFLETGSMEFFAPARRFYRAAGFEPCEPFGTYLVDPNSVFMTREVAPAPPCL